MSGERRKPKPSWQDFERAFAEDRLAFLGLVLQQREDQFLLAQAVGAFEFGLGGHLDEFGDVEEF